MNKPSVANGIEGLNALSDVDQREVYNSIKRANWNSATKALAKFINKRRKKKPQGSQQILSKDTSFDLLPNQYVRNHQEIWRLESIIGSDTVRKALRKHPVLNADFVEELFKQSSYLFYVNQPETYLFSDYGEIEESEGGPLKQLTALDALRRYGLKQLEESKEKQYVRL